LIQKVLCILSILPDSESLGAVERKISKTKPKSEDSIKRQTDTEKEVESFIEDKNNSNYDEAVSIFAIVF
jgi:hypothetical protein